MDAMDVRDAVKDVIPKKSPGRLSHRWNNLATRRVALQIFFGLVRLSLPSPQRFAEAPNLSPMP